MSNVRDSSSIQAAPAVDARSPLFVAARVLLASLFLISGVRKLLYWSATAGYFTKIGLPAPEVVLALVVALEIGAGLAVALGWNARIAALALAVFTLAAAFLAHAFWSVDPAQYGNQFNHFWKNVSIAGGLLCVAAFAGPREPAAAG